VIATRWAVASRPGRRALLPGLGGAACLVLLSAVMIVDLVAGARSDGLFFVAICSLAVVPVAFLAGLLRSRLARGGVAELFRGLRTMQPGELQAALARSLGDPELLIAYPVGESERDFVDDVGRPVSVPDPGDDRSIAVVERDGRRIAVLVHDRSLDEDPELVEAACAAAAIAVENRLLHQEVDARIAQVRASRERIVAAGDAERRRIERNLHDGAQQRLVTLALQLSLIARQIGRDPAAAELLVSSARDELAHSLQELRELARGIHPAVLDDGLEPALAALALRSAVPTTVSYGPGARLPEAVEFAAYLVASEALANVAKYAQASAASVRVALSGRHVVVEISDDGVGGADASRGSGLRGLADRVETLNGSLRVASPAGGGTVVTAELPHEG
jgi:signal transduction histidine kinase